MGRKKEFTGTVTSDKMTKTIVVKIKLISKHPKYGRMMRSYNTFKAHDEKSAAKVGDIVKIEETRPLSKDKRFRLVEVLKKSQAPHVEIKEEKL